MITNRIWLERLAQSREKIQENKNKRYKIKERLFVIVIIFIILCIYYPQHWKRLIYPHFYGKPTDEKLQISATDHFEDFPNNTPKISFSRNGESYLLTPKTKYSVTGKVGYVDSYDGFWNQFYRGHSQNRYINLAPIDLIIVIGNMAKPEIYKLFTFSHAERTGYTLCKGVKYKKSFFNFYLSEREYQNSTKKAAICEPKRRSEEWNNYHPIPANNNISKALHMILPEDTVYIEGILVDVDEMGLKTGTRKQQQHEFLMSGYNPEMCFILYTTKIILNNHIYQ